MELEFGIPKFDSLFAYLKKEQELRTLVEDYKEYGTIGIITSQTIASVAEPFRQYLTAISNCEYRDLNMQFISIILEMYDYLTVLHNGEDVSQEQVDEITNKTQSLLLNEPKDRHSEVRDLLTKLISTRKV